jgi:hypothetical protein
MLLLLLALALAGWLRLLLTASCIHVIIWYRTLSVLQHAVCWMVQLRAFL